MMALSMDKDDKLNDSDGNNAGKIALKDLEN